MVDHGRAPDFGVFVIPAASSLAAVSQQVARAEELGLDLVGIQDHPYQRRFVDTFALITALAATTRRIRFFPDVACLPLRPPALLAKTAATIDLLSGGRFELGLGAGAFWDAIVGYGGPRRAPGAALQALEEAIDVIRLLWSGERSLRYDGDHYRLDGVHAGPVPAHPMGIWLGVGGPKALDLVGRKADGWVPSLPRTPIAGLDEKQAIIDAAARSAGRDPSVIRRVANVNGRVTDAPVEGETFHGPIDEWVERLTGLVVDHGFDGFVFWPDGDPAGQVERFAAVAAEVRDAVSLRRVTPRPPPRAIRNGPPGGGAV